MPVQNWSDNILIAELQDDPTFTDDLNSLQDQLETQKEVDVVMNFSAVQYLNSSNIARLLKIRKHVLTSKRRMVLCGITTNVWGLFLVTGLDKVFDCTDSVATALATVQIADK